MELGQGKSRMFKDKEQFLYRELLSRWGHLNLQKRNLGDIVDIYL